MSDPVAAVAPVVAADNPLVRAALLVASSAFAAGWGADAAVQRAGASEASVKAAIVEAIRPLRDEIEDGARERRKLRSAVQEILDHSNARAAVRGASPAELDP